MGWVMVSVSFSSVRRVLAFPLALVPGRRLIASLCLRLRLLVSCVFGPTRPQTGPQQRNGTSASA